jgi:integrase
MRGKHWELDRRSDSAYYQVVFYPPGGGGRRVRRSTGCSDEAQAQLRAGEIWVSEMRRAGAPVPEEIAAAARPLVEDVVAEFMLELEQLAGQHREQYVARYKADLNLYVTPKTDEELREARALKKSPWQPSWRYLDEISTARWDDEQLRLHKSNGGPLGARSLQVLTNTLRHLLRFAAKRGHITVVPELKAPSRAQVMQERRPRRAFTPAERERFLKAVAKYKPEDHGKALRVGTAARFYEALFFTLFRRGEMWAIAPRWLDLEKSNINIPAAHSKSKKDETIPLHPRALRALQEQMKAAGFKRADQDKPIFGKINVRPAYEFALAQTKIDPFGVTPHHTTRHTGGTILAKATNDREALKKAGRWRSDQSVEAYLHIDAEHARPLMAKL